MVQNHQQGRGKKRLGLIVNPIAGIGGRVGLKGSDGIEIQQKALSLGAVPESQQRACRALQVLLPFKNEFDLVTYPAEMGETCARLAGFDPSVIGNIRSNATSAEDTSRAAREMQAMGVDLLLFAGGDGTARDIYRGVNTAQPVLGIPAGVKIYSAVYAVYPTVAGELARNFLQGTSTGVREAEVVDLDEDAYRSGRVSTCLFGYLTVPFESQKVQNKKVPSPASEAVQMGSIAVEVAGWMEPGWLYFLGPGTTTRAIASHLGLTKTLVGVDVVTREKTILPDANQAQLLDLLDKHLAKIIVTPIGGQGFLFGRGNQQIGPQVLRRVTRQNILVVSTQAKLNTLNGQPFLLDSGDSLIDEALEGYYSVVVGYKERIIYAAAR